MALEKSKVEELAQFAKNGKIEITHRVGDAQKFLEPVKPIAKEALSISGDIGTVYEFLRQRCKLFKADNCNIAIDTENYTITFHGNEQKANADFETVVVGKLELSKNIKEFPFGKSMNNRELAANLRMRRNLFESQEVYKKAYAQLIAFKAEIDRKIENVDDRQGNKRQSVTQEVIHNITPSFRLKTEVLKGSIPISIEVEVDICPETLECTLHAFDLNADISNLAGKILTDELEKVIEEVPMKDWCFTYFN